MSSLDRDLEVLQELADEAIKWTFPPELLTWPKLTAQAFKAYCLLLLDCREAGVELPARVSLSLTEFGRRLGATHASAGRWMSNLVAVGLAEKLEGGRGSSGVAFRILHASEVAAAAGFRVVKPDAQGVLFELDENGSVQLELNTNVQPADVERKCSTDKNGSVQLLEAAVGVDRFSMWFSGASFELDQDADGPILVATLASSFHVQHAEKVVRGTDLQELRIRLITADGEEERLVRGHQRHEVCENSDCVFPPESSILNSRAEDQEAEFVARMEEITRRLERPAGIYQWIIAGVALLVDRGLVVDGHLVSWSEDDLGRLIERVNGKRDRGGYFVACVNGRLTDELGRPAKLAIREVADRCRDLELAFSWQWMQVPTERSPLRRRQA